MTISVRSRAKREGQTDEGLAVEGFVKLWLFERFRREILEAKLTNAENPDMRRFKKQLNAAARNLRTALDELSGD